MMTLRSSSNIVEWILAWTLLPVSADLFSEGVGVGVACAITLLTFSVVNKAVKSINVADVNFICDASIAKAELAKSDSIILSKSSNVRVAVQRFVGRPLRQQRCTVTTTSNTSRQALL